jgi:hypothetical protein
MKRTLLTVLAVLPLFVLPGCVERKLLVRTEPAGAPLSVDDAPAGRTPEVVYFDHYGQRRIRVGPIRSEAGKVQYRATERMVDLRPPWYQWFPLDFFFEVLWPGALVDKRTVTIPLTASSELKHPSGADRAKEVLEEAETYREKALSPLGTE